MRDIRITTGKTVRGGRVQRKKAKWEQLVKRLTTFKVAPITLAEYKKISQDEKAELKNAFGFIIGGYFKNKTRKKDALVAKTLITLDLDFMDPWDMEGVLDTYKDYEFVAHSTMSHMNDAPKLRIVFPVTRDIHPEEYEPVARMMADLFDINAVDKVSYRPAQLMYWPAHPSDCIPWSHHNEGKEVDPDEVLSWLDDWRDFGTWPCADRDIAPRPPHLKAEDPRTKGGAVGAFTRCFDVHGAIARFDLPYSPTDNENRYTPAGSSGGSGAVIYDDGLFIFSHHSQDVASDKLLNAYDLTRISKFGDLDEGYDGDWAKAPSQDAMRAFAMDIDEVYAQTAEDEGLIALDDDDDEPGADKPRKKKKKDKQKKITFDTLLAEIETLKDMDQCRRFIRRLGAVRRRLSQSEIEVLAAALRKQFPDHAPSKKSLLEDIKDVARHTSGDDTGIRDVEEEIAKHILAEAFNDQELRYIGMQYWAFSGGIWTAPYTSSISKEVQRVIMDLRTQQPEDKLDLVSAIESEPTTVATRRMMSFMGPYIANDRRDIDPLGLRQKRACAVNTGNCELWWDDDKEKLVRCDHNPRSFFTSQVFVNFDPKAKECPEWDRFCEQVLFRGHDEPDLMQAHLEELGGYLTNFSRWLKTWVLFHGPTNSGKTTLGRVFSNMLGPSAVHQKIAHYDGRNSHATAGLVGKLLLLDDDFAKGDILPDGFLKQVSEDKEFTANPKGKEEFKFLCRALPLVMSNHWPPTRDVSDALRLRAMVFDFKYSMTRQEMDDRRMMRMLNDEMPAILNRFLAGLTRLRRRGHWDAPYEADEAREAWASRSNPVAAFAADSITRNKKITKGQAAKASEVWGAYTAWCHRERRNSIAQSEFYERMGALGMPRVKTGDGIYRCIGVASVRNGEFE